LKNIIQFINKSEFEQIHLPEPIIKSMPDWYKKSSISLHDKDNLRNVTHSDSKKNEINTQGIKSMETDFTIKKCMPIFDAMTLAYVIKLPSDITAYKIKYDTGTHIAFEWNPVGPVMSHGIEQASEYPIGNIHKSGIPKFINPWIIRTPPGYSCLFLPPMHRDAPFAILPGVVDTDTFTHAVNFPFVMTDPNFEGKIEGGTPIVQVIPFKRDTFEHEIYDAYDYVEKYPDTPLFESDFPESYKKVSWNKKQYH
jgi:hypothetical protein